MRIRGLAAIGAIVLTAGLLTIQTAPPAQAWNNGNCRKNNGLTIYAIAQYPGPAGNAISDWTVGTGLTFQTSGTPEMYLGAAAFGVTGNDGYTYTNCPSGVQVAASYTYGNSTYTDGYSATGKRQLISHEIGHAMGIDHVGPANCSNIHLMYPTSERYFVCGLFTLTQDEKDGMHALY